ncbi:MAG TPA: hypothetical protein VH951_02710 [Dehalococcoidia bacterium]
MPANLKLVVDNSRTEKIVASIRPLDGTVAPSDQFRKVMKLRLLDLKTGGSGPAQAA